MKNSKNKHTTVLIIILLILLGVAYKVMFAPADQVLLTDENIAASQRVEKILGEIKDISLDTSIMEDPSFKSFRSIETPLISLPVGRKNPFADVFNSN